MIINMDISEGINMLLENIREKELYLNKKKILE